ncbi:MAG: hypothetical protein KF764_32040 [Labilithrix sp.]|nr:hypothetical protein [Labilithrix sp.]MBX3224163.1 hypothetical protein [Labilithrix sp.]
MQTAENMLALKNIGIALALGIVACSTASSPVPGSSEDNSVKVPPFSNDSARPPTSKRQPDQNIETPPPVAKPTPSAPAPECPTEQEPNNEGGQATEFTGCITGELTGWTDTDYLKITAPEDATDMVIDHVEPKGTIAYSVTIPSSGGGSGGSSNFNMSFTDKAPKTKVKPGQTYLFVLKWDNNGQGATTEVRPYSLRVAFE